MRLFGVRLAPGVRLSLTPRGLRAHVGPRGARLHMGGGGTGVSTGAGPFTYYQTVAAGRRRRTPQPSTSGAAASKALRAQQVDAHLRTVTTLHHADYDAVPPPEAHAPPVPPLPALRAEARRELLTEVRWYDVAGRWRAHRESRVVAERRHAELVADAWAAQRQEQEALDGCWRRFVEGDAEAVLWVLNGAFADNEAPAAAVGLDGDEAQLAVLVPGEEAVPDRMPGVTDAGNVSLRQMTKTQTAEIHRAIVAGHLLATVKEAFAVAPTLRAVAIVALRHDGPDVYGEDCARPLVAARFAREALTGVRWREAAAWDIVEQASTDLRVELYGRTGALEPLDLSEEPDLAALAELVGWD